MSLPTLKNLVLYAALALSPALLSAQGMTGSPATPPASSDQATKPASDQTTKPADSQDAMAYRKELDACDKTPSADRETCRNAVDQKYGKKSSNTAPGSAK